jgi:hypothetical protein
LGRSTFVRHLQSQKISTFLFLVRSVRGAQEQTFLAWLMVGPLAYSKQLPDAVRLAIVLPDRKQVHYFEFARSKQPEVIEEPKARQQIGIGASAPFNCFFAAPRFVIVA